LRLAGTVAGEVIVAAVERVSSRNARFQQWTALLGNRGKRQRAGEFLVQGVRPVTIAAEAGWPIRELLFDGERELSRWARDLLGSSRATRYALAKDLMAELGEKDEAPPELIAVAAIPPDDLGRIPTADDLLALALDRPAFPGNIGSIIRSADALGASGVITCGHSADAYDPKSVRASTGSLFALPVARLSSPQDVAVWIAKLRADGLPVVIAGADEHGDADVFSLDLTGPVLLVIGSEATGMSSAWRDLCDVTISIPMAGSASSLNAANAATVILYEAARQRINSAARRS
jgi:23S rRNA (uridine2479-2'-O)-methyltransferase